MAQNITLMGADYPDVPAVDLPKTGGGTARFVDALGVVTSVNGETGDVTVDSESIGALPTSAKSALYYGQVDSTSTSTAYTAQIPGITEYFDGLTVILKNGVVTSASGFTININGLGAKHAYSNMAAATAETTLFNINYTMMFIYDSTRVSGGGWILYRGYYSDANSIGYQLRTTSMSLPMTSITYRYRLLFESADHAHFVPANNSSSTNATSSRTVCQNPINPLGEIRYYGTTASVAAGARPAVGNLWEQYGITLGYSFNRTGAALVLTHWKPVYVKCAPQSDGSAIIDADTPYVQTLPSTEDGKIYIYLGVAYSDTQVELVPHHPVYWYKDGMIRLWTNAAASSGGVTSWNGQTGAVTYTAPVTSVNGNTGAVTVTEGLAPLIGTTSTVTPQQVMTALGEGRDICIEATGALGILPLALKFTDFNRATDTAYSGAVADIVASQTIINDGVTWYVYTLVGGSMQGQSIPWTVSDMQMVPSSRTINGYTLDQNITISLSDLNGVPTSRRINNKSLANDITLRAADVYATPNLASGSQNTVCFGDSLFGMYRGDDSAPAYARQIAGGIVENVGFGGCRMSVHPTHGYAEFSMWALAKAVAENDFTAQDQYASSGQDYFADQLAILKDINWNATENVVIHYGTNDFQGGVPLDDATHSNDYNTICGALRYSIEKLLTAYPHLKIFVSLPVFRYWTEGGVTTYSDTKTNSNDITLPEVCKALNNVAYEYGLPVIDGYNGLGVNKVNASYYYTDGTHHNDKGRKRFGNFIGRNLVSPQPAHYIGAQEEGPSYTNMLDEAGWTDGVRLSSSGADSADAGFVTSGYIPCQYLDYIYLKNINYNSAASSASSQRICFYDSSKTFISGCISGANATAQLGKEYDSNNDLVKFQIANVGSYSAANAAYFRICAPHIGSDSIITVNEPIE